MGDDDVARPAWAATDALLRDYYDNEWGGPVRDERGLFERLSLEAFQSGLSWATILRKRPAFRAAFVGFDPDALLDADGLEQRIRVYRDHGYFCPDEVDDPVAAGRDASVSHPQTILARFAERYGLSR